MPKDLAALLAEEGAVPAEVMERALERQRTAGGALDTALLELGAIPEEALVVYLARAADLPAAPDRAWTGADARARRVFPSRVAERHGLAPFALDGRELSLVATHPVDVGLLDEISFMLSLHLTAHVGPEWRVHELIHRLYGSPLSPRLAALAGGPAAEVQDAPAAEVQDALASVTEAPAMEAAGFPAAEAPAEPQAPPPAPPISGFARDESEPLEPLAAALQQALEAVDVSFFEDVPEDGQGEEASEGDEPEPEPEPEVPPDRSAPPRWALEDARAALAAARHRDEVVLVVLRYARDFFEYAALFAVTRDAVAGHDALGAEEERDRVRAFAIWASDPGLLKTVIDTRSPYLGPVSLEAPGNEAILAGLGRKPPRTALVHPVLLRDRVVCVVYADNGEAPVSARRLGDLALLLAAAGPAFERIIRDRKKAPRRRRAAERPPAAPPEEARAPGAPPVWPEPPVATAAAPPADPPAPDEGPPPASEPPPEDPYEFAVDAPAVEPLRDPPEAPSDPPRALDPPATGSLMEIEEAFFTAGDSPPRDPPPPAPDPPAPAPERAEAPPSAPEPVEAPPGPDPSRTQRLPAPAPVAAPPSTPVALAERALDADAEAAAAACAALAERRRDPAIRAANEKLRRALLSGIAARAARAARAIGAIRDVESIPLLIQVLETSEPDTAQAAADALAGITLQRIGPDARRWLTWWKENRGRGRAEWLFSGLTSADRETRIAAAVELSVAAPPPVAYSADLPPADRERIARAWAGWWARSGHVL